MTFPCLFLALAVHGNVQTAFERQPRGAEGYVPGGGFDLGKGARCAHSWMLWQRFKCQR